MSGHFKTHLKYPQKVTANFFAFRVMHILKILHLHSYVPSKSRLSKTFRDPSAVKLHISEASAMLS